MKLNGAGIIVETLIEQGVDAVFGYPGGAVLHIYDELYKAADRITHYTTCHEQGACHAADGYARASGKTGVVIATSGPGATNLVTGIANAYLDSTPLVAITGNVARALIGRDSFQEVDITGITMPITKHNYIVKDVNRLADIMREAFEIARSGRPGPVLIDVPKDIQTSQAEFTPAKPAARPEFTQAPAIEQLERAAELIKQSQRPFIYSGGGVIIADAAPQLKAFAEAIDAPVGTSMMGITVMGSENPYYLGMTGMHGKYAASLAMSKCDLLIAVGTRFSDRATGHKEEFYKGRKILHIDIDPAEIGKNIPPYISLIGDVRQVLGALTALLPPITRPSWREEVQQIKSSPDVRLDMPRSELNPQTVIEAVRAFAADDDVVATDVGQHQMWTAQYYKFSRPRTLVTSGGLGTMGFGFGAAIGACIGRGKKRTVLFTSDGSFHMNMNELATAVSNELPIVIMLLNNQALGMVRQWQSLFFDKRYSNTSLERRTDYVMFAKAMGADGLRVSSLDQLAPALEKAFSAKGPVLVEAVIDHDQKVLPMIPPGGTIKDIILRG